MSAFKDKEFLTLKETAYLLSVSDSTIERRIGIEFIEGKHFVYYPNTRIRRFNKQAIINWAIGKDTSKDIVKGALQVIKDKK